MHWNVGNLLLCTGMLAICCYVLECWQFVVILWKVGNLLLCTEMLAICCYALKCWQFHDKTNKHKQMLHCRYNVVIFVQIGNLKILTFLQFQHSTYIAFPGIYFQSKLIWLCLPSERLLISILPDSSI